MGLRRYGDMHWLWCLAVYGPGDPLGRWAHQLCRCVQDTYMLCIMLIWHMSGLPSPHQSPRDYDGQPQTSIAVHLTVISGYVHGWGPNADTYQDKPDTSDNRRTHIGHGSLDESIWCAKVEHGVVCRGAHLTVPEVVTSRQKD